VNIDLKNLRKNKMTKTKYICEACGKNEIYNHWHLIDKSVKNVIYKLCSDCIVGLFLHTLKPKEYFRLLKNGHDDEEFEIHGDFYEKDTGEAWQPYTLKDIKKYFLK